MKRSEFIALSASTALVAMFDAHGVLSNGLIKSSDTPSHLINSLRLQTTTPLSQMKEFYGNTLGLPILESTNTKLTIAAGQSTITFTKTESTSRPFYHFAFNIPENKIERAFAWQRDRTPVVHPSPAGSNDSVVHFRHWNAHSVFFLDPAGNLLEYIARHDLKNRVNGDFSMKDILYVSEIAFIVDDVEQAGTIFRTSLGLNSYRPAVEQFWPLGNEHGLLLMIGKGRVWTSNPNQTNSVDVFKTSVTINSAARSWTSSMYPYEILVTK